MATLTVSRAPKVGDFVLVGGEVAYADPLRRVRGRVAVVERATAATAWLSDGNALKANRSKWLGGPWAHVTHVAAAEAKRWLSAAAELKAWRGSIPDGAVWVSGWHTIEVQKQKRARWIEVQKRARVRDADHADATAAIYAAVAAWLRKKPDPDAMLITIAH